MFSSKIYTSRPLHIIEHEITECKEKKKKEEDADALIKKCEEDDVCKRKAEVHFDKSKKILDHV